MGLLKDKIILIGLTGGIACYKIAELVRLLMKEGAHVQVAMTEDATRFITPLTLQALSGRQVVLSTWDASFSHHMQHIDLTRNCDAILIAPASSDFIAQLACGRASNVLSLICLARPADKVPLLIAPAMNREMWKHPATQRNAQQVAADGAIVLTVGLGEQACGEVGLGRMLEPSELMHELQKTFTPQTLAGRHVLVNAGPTWEAIDPVRGVSNLSSGKMGFAIAQAAWEAGAHVTLVAGPVTLETPYQVRRLNVTSAIEMFAACEDESQRADIFFATAAVADWTIHNSATQKIKKQAGQNVPTLEWKENPDILATIANGSRARSGKLFCVGFAAESHDMEQHATLKRQRKNVPILVANDGPQTFGKDNNTLIVVTEEGLTHLPSDTKINLARHLVSTVAYAAALTPTLPNDNISSD